MKRHSIVILIILFSAPPVSAGDLFLTSDQCMACHNGLTTAKGEDVSIGFDWRPTMMANSARDPYWQAGVRRETLDHPTAKSHIEQECSICHMPMAHVQGKALGVHEEVFNNLGRGATGPRQALAQDGVSCTVCHQIQDKNFGKQESFVGGFSIDTNPTNVRIATGPFSVKPTLARFMASATGFTPTQSTHVQRSELCATCHTLITTSLGPDGKAIGRFPEQVPYHEWLESGYRTTQSCVDCHMPKVQDPAPMANVLGEPRVGLARHEFLGGNFVVPALLKRLGTPMPALSQDIDHEVKRTRAFLAKQAAKLAVESPQIVDGKLQARLVLENLAGHKLPTAYPSRRVWLHITVKDRSGAVLFESGAPGQGGKIVGNDNDTDPLRYEPHYQTITKPDQVQIYEAILGDSNGKVTTGLLQAIKYVKDNRVTPSGFQKAKASADVKVHGEAHVDADFVGGRDGLQLSVQVGKDQAPYQLEAEVLYQPIGFRWAENLRKADSEESRRFNKAFDEITTTSYQRLAYAVASVEGASN
jgi:hypothetical protein